MRPKALLVGLATIVVSATSFAGGVVRDGRTLAPTVMQEANVAGRVTTRTSAGVRTTHHVRPAHEVTEGVISRASHRDPLVMHSSSVKSVRAGDAATFRVGNYEYAIGVSERALIKRIDEVVPELRLWLRSRTSAPTSVSVHNGRWFLETGGEVVPVRAPLIHRRLDGAGVM